MDRWEELAGLHSDFRDTFCTPDYGRQEVIASNEIIDVSGSIHADTIRCLLPKGQWRIIRLAAVLTGAKSKHTDTGSRENVTADSQGQFTISFSANESIFVTF